MRTTISRSLKQSVIAPKPARILVATVLFGAGMSLVARAAGETNASAQLEHPDYWPFTVGVEGGTTGLGASLSWRFLSHFGARAGADYLSYSDHNFTPKNVSYDADLRLLSEPLTFDIYPWARHDFHVSVGVLFNQNQVSGSANHTGIFQRDQFLDMKIEPQLVNPYLSVGGTFFHFDRAHRWGLGGELGAAYSPSMDVSLSGKGLLPDLIIRKEGLDLKDYAQKLKFWPVIKIMVTYSF